MTDSLEHLSDEAKRAWQRGFNLAHPRKGARFVLEDRPGESLFGGGRKM
jgi:hypothetical protein